MLQRDQETKELNSKQTVDHINQKIQQYKAQMSSQTKKRIKIITSRELQKN